MIEPKREGWSNFYTLVLVLNVVYIIVFLILMNTYAS